MKSTLFSRKSCKFLAMAVALVLGAKIYGAEETPAKSTSNLPKAREIVDKYLQVMGGKEALLKKSSQHAKGTFKMEAQGLNGDLEIWAAKPDSLYMKIELPGFGQILTGYDGTNGWSVDPALGPRLMEGKQLEQMRQEADFLAPLHEEKNFKSMETTALTQFDDQECYQLKLVRNSGDEVIEYYDVKSGYLVGNIMTQETPLGKIKVTNSMGEYKKFDDLQVATKSVQKMMTIQQVISLSEIDFNKVDKTVFEPPASIKALLKK